ncbi:hypothetical protein Celaphus_00015635, partial [Cervus elaphus hippelaphus]
DFLENQQSQVSQEDPIKETSKVMRHELNIQRRNQNEFLTSTQWPFRKHHPGCDESHKFCIKGSLRPGKFLNK